MSSITIQKASTMGLYAGAGIAVAPVATTFFIASSRALLINVIANTILRICTGGAFGINFYGLSLIEVPFLWKISLISALAGSAIAAVSLTVGLANSLYLQLNAPQKKGCLQKAKGPAAT